MSRPGSEHLAVAGVVLAAGRSVRMGAFKPLLDVDGSTFVARLVGTLRRGGCNPVTVVAAAPGGALSVEVSRAGGRIVVNEDGRGGQIGSLRCALRSLRALAPPPAAVMFTPVDNPTVSASTVRELISAWRHAAQLVVVPRFGRRRGHPALVDMSLSDEFFGSGLREGARTVIRADPERVLEVEVRDPAVIEDLDTRREYEARYRPGWSHSEDA